MSSASEEFQTFHCTAACHPTLLQPPAKNYRVEQFEIRVQWASLGQYNGANRQLTFCFLKLKLSTIIPNNCLESLPTMFQKGTLTWLAAVTFALWPLKSHGSTLNSALVMDVGVMEECPPANQDTTCPPAITQSDLWPVAHLEPCAASNGPNLFAEDPFCSAVLHACNDRGSSSSSGSAEGGRRAALPNACGDFRFKDVAVDERRGHLYIASTWAVHKAAVPANLLETTSSASSSSSDTTTNAASSTAAVAATADPLTNSPPLVTGFSVVHLKGFNLGASRAEVVGIWLRGVPCRSVVYFNDTNLACVVGRLYFFFSFLAIQFDYH